MDTLRFDRLTRAIASRLPRRGLLAALGAGGIAALPPVRAARAQSTPAATSGELFYEVPFTCRPCQCDAAGENCECCLNGVTGGGIVRTETGDATLVLFATAVGDEAERQATGFVRWIDPAVEGGVTLESVGPIVYTWNDLETPQNREIRGTMAVNGASEEPFVLRVVDGAPGAVADTAWLEVGDLAALRGESDRFAYSAAGEVIGGDIQLLDDVATVGSLTASPG